MLMEPHGEVNPPSRTATPTIEYSSAELASIAFSANSAPADLFEASSITPMDPVHMLSHKPQKPLGQIPKPRCVQNAAESFKGRQPTFESICFECFLPGHRRPLCPHLNRTMVGPAFKQWVASNFSALLPWQQAWLQSIGRAPSNTQQPKLAHIPQPTRAPPISNTPAAPALSQSVSAQVSKTPLPSISTNSAETEIPALTVEYSPPEASSTPETAVERTLPSPMQPPSPIIQGVEPFGLPSCMDLDDYRDDPVCYLSQFNYKLEARVGPSVQDQQCLLTVLDTGAGPNLIRADLLPQRLLDELDRSQEVINLASASKHRLDVLGITQLTVTIASYTARMPFVGVRQLGTDVILGCHFIDKAVDSIQIRHRRIALTNGSHAPIIRRRAVAPSTRSSAKSKAITRRATRPNNII
eukprot:IDg17931t1